MHSCEYKRVQTLGGETGRRWTRGCRCIIVVHGGEPEWSALWQDSIVIPRSKLRFLNTLDVKSCRRGAGGRRGGGAGAGGPKGGFHLTGEEYTHAEFQSARRKAPSRPSTAQRTNPRAKPGHEADLRDFLKQTPLPIARRRETNRFLSCLFPRYLRAGRSRRWPSAGLLCVGRFPLAQSSGKEIGGQARTDGVSALPTGILRFMEFYGLKSARRAERSRFGVQRESYRRIVAGRFYCIGDS